MLRVRSSRGALLALVLTLVTAWAALLFGALPSPAALNFPLNDDWVYSRTFFHFLRGEPLRFYNWPSMPQIGMWWMPWLMAQLFGATHAALRYGTVLFSLAGAAAVYDLLRQGGVSPRRAAFAAATFGLTPLYFLCSATFMTDVPSLALALCSMALLLRGVRGQGVGQGVGYLIAGAVIATMAAMTRQNTLAVPVVMLYVALRGRPAVGGPRLAAVWVSLAVPVLAGLATHVWFSRFTDGMKFPMAVPGPSLLVYYFYSTVCYLGLMALPVTLLTLRQGDLRRRTLWVAVVVTAAVSGLLYAKQGATFPYLGNLLTSYGQFGADDHYFGVRPLILGPASRLGLTVAGAFAGALLVARLGEAVRSRGGRLLGHPLVLFTLLQFPPLLIAQNFFDRYLVTLLPGVLLLLTGGGALAPPASADLDAAVSASRPGSWRTVTSAVALATLAAYGAFSLALTRDWLAWNSALWALGRRTVAAGVAPLDIDGGLEWNLWHASHEPKVYYRGIKDGHVNWDVIAENEARYPERMAASDLTGRLLRLQARHGISFSPIRDAEVIDTEPYRLWLAPGERRLYLVRAPQGR